MAMHLMLILRRLRQEIFEAKTSLRCIVHLVSEQQKNT